jgi:signal transduction histidine kinase
LDFEFWDEAFFVWLLISMFFISMGILVSGSAQISRRAQEGMQRERQLKENLERSLLEQSRLKRVILHEVKQPLNAFSSQIELAIKSGTPLEGASLSRMFLRMKDAIAFIRSLDEIDEFNEIFDDPNFTELSLDDLISCISIHNSVTTIESFAGEGYFLDLDLALFDIALGNILDNAIKFGRGGMPDVKLELKDNFLSIDVQDEGDGIALEEQGFVFEIFERGRAAQVSGKPGYGIGLHIARRVARLHGGDCVVSSYRPSIISLIFPIRCIREAAE